MKKLLLFVCSLALVSIISCSEEDDKYKITIRLERTGVANGTIAYGKICEENEGDISCTAKYSGSAVFSGEVATLEIDDIKEGTYTAGVFIDVDGDSADTLIPDCDIDVATGDQNVKIDEDINNTIEHLDWEGPGAGDIPGCEDQP